MALRRNIIVQYGTNDNPSEWTLSYVNPNVEDSVVAAAVKGVFDYTSNTIIQIQKVDTVDITNADQTEG